MEPINFVYLKPEFEFFYKNQDPRSHGSIPSINRESEFVITEFDYNVIFIDSTK